MDISNVKIAIVEDDKIHMDILAAKLYSLGCHNITRLSSFESAILEFDQNNFDILLVDFYLDNNKTFVDLFDNNIYISHMPIIIISSFYNDTVLDRILRVRPLQFISKACSEFELKKSIIIALTSAKDQKVGYELLDFFFIRSGNRLKNVSVKRIEYVTVSKNYLDISFDGRVASIRTSLNDFAKRLPNNFIRIHQAFLVNINFIKDLDIKENLAIMTNGKELPVSRNYRKVFLDKFQLR